tara:strand:+ start:806 stop:1705 length:900 start_codon:yes stop_codon:yes gene_type:complete
VLILSSELLVFTDNPNFSLPLFKGENGFEWTRLREADTTKNVDVLIVGSSLGMSIDVRRFNEFGLRAFNLSSGSQSPIQTKYLLAKYLPQFQPKYLIWDFHAYTFSNYGIESIVDIVSNCQDCTAILPMILQTENPLAINTYIKRVIFRPFEDPSFVEPRQSEFVRYIAGGYMETNFKSSDAIMEMQSFRYDALDLQKKTFEDELKMLAERGIKLILVSSPKSFEYNSNFINSEEWSKYARHLVEIGLVEDYLDFNELLPEFQHNTAFFIDIAHLAAPGVSAYNDALITELSNKMRSLN